MPCQQDTPSPWRPLTSYHGNERTNWGEWKSWHTAQKNRLKNRNRLSSEQLERQEKAARGVERKKCWSTVGRHPGGPTARPESAGGAIPTPPLPTNRFLFPSLLHLPSTSLPPASLGNLLSTAGMYHGLRTSPVTHLPITHEPCWVETFLLFLLSDICSMYYIHLSPDRWAGEYSGWVSTWQSPQGKGIVLYLAMGNLFSLLIKVVHVSQHQLRPSQ